MADRGHSLGVHNAMLAGADGTPRMEGLPLSLRVRFGCVSLLRRVWRLVPGRLAPMAYDVLTGAAGTLPPRARRRVAQALARLRAQNSRIRRGYAAWVRLYEPVGEEARRQAADRITAFTKPVRISVVMPVFNPHPGDLRAAIASVAAQFYPHWTLCIADDASTDPAVTAVIKAAVARDPRVRVVWRPRNGHIAAASNSALDLADGDYVALLDHDDLLAPHALYEVARRIDAAPSLDILFSDEDKIDREGKRFDPYFKPGWNPALMLGQNLINHLAVYRLSLLRRIGGFRAGMEGSQDYDLALRALQQTKACNIGHIPMVLYHWRQRGQAASFSERAPALCSDHARQAVQAFVSQGAPGAVVVPAPGAPIWNRVVYPLPQDEPLVSVIIPSRNQAGMLRRCLMGLLEQTEYRALDVLIVDNGSDEPEAQALLRQLAVDPRVRVLPAPGPFNFSALNNRAAAEARGDVLLLLNNDISVIHPDWMREMVSYAIQPTVGAVGAKLLYPDDRIQHGGVLLGMGGVAGHQYLLWPRDDTGYFGQLALARDVGAVTAACLMVRRSVYQEVGGLNDRDLAVAFNDVDFCMRVEDRGYRNVWTPFAELYHHESASRGSDRSGEKAMRFRRETEYMERHWGARLYNDRYWNPNLALDAPGPALSFPPRMSPGDPT
jgi:GT2 family glycosyltransferase